jgi:hypothetical protein
MELLESFEQVLAIKPNYNLAPLGNLSAICNAVRSRD